MKKYGVNLNNISSHVKKASYAVRGPIIARSQELAKEGRPIISCNIGNPQALNQKPITFLRDVLSLCINPRLIDQIKFPKDVVERAQRYLTSTPSLGAYTESQGIFSVRQDICNFLKQRDGFPAAPSDIFLTNGASDGIRLTMQALFKDVGTLFKESSSLSKEGLLTPIPQYPLYSALSTLMQVELVPYYLNEAKDWTVTSADLDKSLATARGNGINTRAMVVINPGNPTGQCLSLKDMQVIVLWCHHNEILLLADEVYQENVYKRGAKFISFRKVARDLGVFTGRNGLQMVSYHR
jgi:glutamate--glyoxylate aminotransferase